VCRDPASREEVENLSRFNIDQAQEEKCLCTQGHSEGEKEVVGSPLEGSSSRSLGRKEFPRMQAEVEVQAS